MPLRMGGGPSTAEAVYTSLRDGMGSAYSRDDTTRANRENRAKARAVARAAAAQERGGVQNLPDLASDRLPDWERALQAPIDPSSPPHVRALTCTGILRGNGQPERDTIAAAVTTALGGESVYVIATKAKTKTFGAGTFFSPTVTEVLGGGALSAGLHYLYGAHESAAGVVTLDTVPKTITISASSSILVGPVLVPGETVHYYLSTAAGSTSVAWVASQYGGASPVALGSYPSNAPASGLHHLAVVVSAATSADTIRRAKIHAVLGTMLPSWVTYSIITGSPFVLGTGGSALGRGGF